MFQKYLVSGLALFGMLLCIAAGALAGPAYRVARTSLPEEDNWRQAEGLSIRFDVDVDRCKKEYGANWSRQCSGPPAGQYGTLVEGVRMTPATPGEWRWLNGSSMVFTPEKHLHPQTTYTISLEKVSLPSRFSVNRQLTYTTQPQAARIGKETFWTDPSAKAAHAISVPVYFIWPVNPQDMEKDISLRASNAKSGLSFGTPRFIWNEKCTEVVVSVPVMSLPGENSSAVLRVQGLPDFIEKNGKRTVRPGKANRENVEALFAVVGRDRIMNVQSVTVKTAYGRGLEKEYHLIVKTSLRMLPSELLHHLEVIQLPEKITPEAGQEADWTKMPAISANDIKRGKKLQPDLLQPADEASDTIALRIPAGAGRGLLASVKKGLISIGGMSLTEARRFILTTPPLGAELNFLQPGNIVTLSGDKKLDIYAVGLTGIQWRAERVRDPFLALLAKDSGFEENTADFTVMSDAVQGHLDMRGFGDAKAPGESFFGVLDLAPLLRGPDGPKHGLMRMTVTGHNADRQVAEVSRLLLVTDMGLNVKTASDGTRAVFVQNLATGKSVANAEVRLLGANGLPVCSAFTNAQGRADLPSAVGLEREKRPVAVVALAAASGGQDMAWLSLDDNARNVDYSNFSVSGRHAAGNGLIASAFSQRGLYLPGEKLHFGCIVRRFDWQPLPAELPLEAVLVSPTGAEVMRRPFTLGAEGLQNFAWNSTEDAAVGQYRLDIRLASGKPGSGSSGPVLGGTSTRIEEFQPDTLALSTSFEPGIPKGWIRTGVGASPAVAVARLDNLYGEPAANHRIRTAFHARKGMLRFPGYEEYVFYDASPSGAQDQYMDLPDAFTSSKGIARLPLPLDRLQGNTFYGTLMIDGFEPEGGRAVTRQMSALFSPLEVALGYKGEEQANNLEYVPQHSRALLRLVAINNDLAPVALRGAEIVFSTRRYVNSLVTDARGEYYYDATPVDTEIKRQTVNLEPQGLSWAMPTSEAGDFLVTVRQANGSILALIPYSVAGDRLADPAGLSTGSLAKGNLRLKLEKEHYQPGETIKMRLSTPYSGTGLITIERENVLTHAWFTAQAGESVQEIQIPEQFEGRGYVNVSFVRSLDSEAVYMNPHTYGMAPFTVGMSRRDMGLKITAPERVLPGEKVTVRLTSRVPGKAVLFAVDEGVLQITGFATPDPLRELLGDRALDVSTMQAFDLLMPDHARLQGRIPGFGGDMAGAGGRFLNPFKRRGEPPFAFWQEVSAVSAEGTEISFDVPAYVSGRIRIMAVGSTSVHDGRSTAGSARADMEVRGSLILKPLLPLAVVPGDEFDAALVIANTVEGSGKDARVAVTMECGPELVFLNGQKPQPIAVNENGEAVLHFRMRAQDVLGSAEVRFTASLEGKEKAGSSTRRQSLSVRPPAPRVRTEQVVALAGDMDVPVNRDLYPYEAQGQATVSALPVLGLRSLLARLDTYPYGCTEQLISRAMPYVALLAAPELRKQALSSPRTSSETLAKRGNAVISAALDTIRSNFRYYEGVSLWPASSANDFVTAYAGDFLLTLRESGVVAPEGLTRNILDSLENTVRRSPVDANDGRIKVYGAWVLLRDGRIMTQEVERLEQWFKENTDGWERDLVAVLLADCYDMLRLKRRAEQLMPSAFVAATGDSMLGQGAAAALHATVVLRHFPEKRQQVNTDVLLDEAFNTAATTVDMGLISRALVMLAGQEASPPEGISLTCTSYAQGFSALEPQDSMRASVLTLDAPGCLNYRASVPRGDKGWNLHVAAEGFERKPLTPASNGLELQRRYVNSNGEAVTSARLGDVLTVELSLRSPAAYANVVVVDLLPGGFEAVLEKSGATESQEGLIRHERREDRGIFFVNTGPQVRTFTYKVRAATRGRFVLPSAMAEAMYEPATNARLGGGYVNIE